MRGIDWKKSEVETITDLAKSNPVVGVASIHEIPARQFQSIRRDLRGKVTIRVSKKRLISQAFAGSGKKNIHDLEAKMGGEVALLFTDMNPFKLFRYLEDRKVKSSAKPGHMPPEDVWVLKGETPFSPGPIVSQLQKAGIPARIERGKVVILEDTLFVRSGEKIDRAKSEILSQLGIEPMRIGLDVSAVYEDGTIFERSILDVDVNELMGQLSLAAIHAFNLAFNSRFPTKATLPSLIVDAYLKAKGLSIAAEIPTADTIGDLLSIGHKDMVALASIILENNPDAVGEDLKGILQKAGRGPEGAKKANKETVEAQQKEAQKEEKQEEEKQRDEESVGLGALFG